MAIDSLSQFLDIVRQNHVLEADQLQRSTAELTGQSIQPRDLARDLVRRGWLTTYQVNQIFQGHASDLLLGSHVLLDRVGEGGMGAVYKARNWKLGRIVALKLIRPERLTHADSVRRFHREIRAVAQLNHPNIVRAYDADEVAGTHLLVMEFVDGIDLSQLVKRQGPLPVNQACDYIRQAALGLQHAHERGLVHRDIKPHNLLLSFSRDPKGSAEGSGTAVSTGSPLNGVVKILDMGLALVAQVEGESSLSSTVTQEGVVMGTPDYLAPEQTLDAHNVDIRADLYSLGCTFYYARELEKLIIEPDAPARDHSGTVSRSSSNGPLEAATIGLSDYAGRGDAELPGATTVFREKARQRGAPSVTIRRPWLVAGIVGGVLSLIILALILIRPGSRHPADDDKVTLKPTPRPKVNEPPAAAPVDDAWIKMVQALPAEEQVEAVKKKLQELNPGFDGEVTHKIENNAVVDLRFETLAVSDISPVRALTSLKTLVCTAGVGEKRGKLTDLEPLRGMALSYLSTSYNPGTDLSPLKGMPLTRLGCHFNPIQSLEPLKGMKLESLSVYWSGVKDLSPLKGMPLKELDIGLCKIGDLSPLKGMPLERLTLNDSAVSDLSVAQDLPALIMVNLNKTRVRDLSPLRGRKITHLQFADCPVSDVSLLREFPLRSVQFAFNPWRGDREILSGIKSLLAPNGKINGQDAAEFLKQADADMAAFDAWVKDVAKLPAEKQVEAVAAELKKRNPGFDGSARPTIAKERVIGLAFFTDKITDIAPVRALADLRHLGANGSGFGKGILVDLWPVKDLPLTKLECNSNRIVDLTPIKGMPLTWFGAGQNQIASLEPLKGMPLEVFGCGANPIGDFSPLKGMRLTVFNGGETPGLTSLEFLKGMPLTKVSFLWSKVSDLSPLKGMALTALHCSKSNVQDFSILKGFPLKEVSADFNIWRDGDLLRSLKNLERINGKPAAEFWKPHDDFDAWVKDVAKLPAEKQVEAVAAELKKRNPGFDGKVKTEIEKDVVARIELLVNEVTDVAPVRALPGLKRLILMVDKHRKAKLSDLWPLRGLGLTTLHILGTQVSELSPLRGMPLKQLQCSETRVADLSPLKGMKLNQLYFNATEVADLLPLKHMPLATVGAAQTKVVDLTPLQGMKLSYFSFSGRSRTAIAMLKGMPLKYLVCAFEARDLKLLQGAPLALLNCDFNVWRDAEVLRSFKTLERINGKDVAEVWKELDDFDAWAKDVAKLPAAKQVEAVDTELKRRNPGFKDQFKVHSEKGEVIYFNLHTDQITDIAPLRVFRNVKVMGLFGTQPGKGKLVDLWPLRGVPVEYLNCQNNPITDLRPLADVPKLQILDVRATKATDLSPLQKTTLTTLNADIVPDRDAAILRAIPTLQTINGRPAAEVLGKAR